MKHTIHICAPNPGQDPVRQRAKRYYQQSIEATGAVLSWLPLSKVSVTTTAEYDGLLLPGGGDPDPALWNAPMEPGCHLPDPLRDHADLWLFQFFYEKHLPILGICRGLQVINIALGGTLHQDILPLQKVCHMAPEDQRHPVYIAPDTRLYSIVQKNRILVNSLHHQAINNLAPALSPSAKSEDGWTEAAEDPRYPFLLGVQWHPERMGQQSLFTAFVDACGKKCL